MKGMNVLVLTDHTRHTKENSLYALVSEMLRHTDCANVFLASRGFESNIEFFNEPRYHALFAKCVNTSIDYSEDGDLFNIELDKVDLGTIDLVFLRLPRPVTDKFLLDLSNLFEGVPMVNEPKGIIETSNKKFLLNFPELCPPMRFVSSLEEIKTFGIDHDIILKPLKEYGGKGIVKVMGDRVHDGRVFMDLEEYFIENPAALHEGYLAMKFLNNVTLGDKRILVVDGEIMASSLRLPVQGSWLCNVAQGGTSISSEVTEEEKHMIKKISPILSDKGILIYGADTLVEDDGRRVLSEINTLSIGGFPQAQKQTGLPILRKTIDKIFEYADLYYA